jgi:hypothetical protein
MDRDEIARRLREIVERDGPWTAHNIHLGHDLHTMPPGAGDEPKIRRVTQIVHDATGGSFRSLRVLDLACLEGGYAIEMALQGARAVGIEGRAISVTKARFAAEALGLTTVEFFEDDVRSLDVDRYGLFDVVLCLGIFYHLDAPDVFRFLERIASVCAGIAVFDTHVGLTGRIEHEWRGRRYRGFEFVEHDPEAEPEKRLGSLWASLDNSRSFWPTRSSLLNMLLHAGFSSVYECQVPAETDKPSDRVTLLAFKRDRVRLKSIPGSDGAHPVEWEEDPRPRPHPDQRSLAGVRKLAGRVRRILRLP